MIFQEVGYDLIHRNDLKPKTTFMKYWTMAYDSTKYMQAVMSNSLLQISIIRANSKDVKKRVPLTPKHRKQILQLFISKARSGELNLCNIPGAPASISTTSIFSCNVTNIDRYKYEEEDVYASYIGYGLSLEVGNTEKSSISLILNDSKLNDIVFSGWKKARYYYDQYYTDKNKKSLMNALSRWNAHYLYSKLTGEKLDVDTVFDSPLPWMQLMFALSIKKNDVVDAYVFNMSGKGNTIIGDVQFDIDKAKRIREIYSKLFGSQIDTVYKSELVNYNSWLSLSDAGNSFIIGLNEFKPKFDTKQWDKNKLYQKQNWRVWLMASINDEDCIQFSKELAYALKQYGKQSDLTKWDHKVDELFKTRTQEKFLEKYNSMNVSIPNFIERFVKFTNSNNIFLFIMLTQAYYKEQ